MATSPHRVSVLMPTFDQEHFIRRAVDSLFAQTWTDWELVIVDDGSVDGTATVLEAYLGHTRVRYRRSERNEGLGAALNRALAMAQGDLIAYLPSDDVQYADHLETLAALLQSRPDAVLVYSGVRHHYNKAATGQIDGYSMQLVQVMHRRTPDLWTERSELVTDDLERLFWSKLRKQGAFVGTDRITCEWVDHPMQGHKIFQEPHGGINPYRSRYGVDAPLRFHSSVGNPIDEVEHYRQFRERADTPRSADALTILLVGELAYNPERVLALEERGHALYGLWTDEPYWFNTVGPLPFGHVRDLPRSGWREAVRRLRPDIIYALLNWQTVPFAHEILVGNPGIPFVWHFKEGPFICLEKGTWSQLIELYIHADGQIYSSPEMRDWFATVVPGLDRMAPSLILDGDLPKREWFAGAASERLSASDGEIHTVVPGRPIGLHPSTVGELAEQGIHLHFYGEYTQGQWKTWIDKVRALAPDHLHLHPSVDQDRWTAEFSRYDAVWLHLFRSENAGDLRRAIWDDLNFPARLATFAAAGLPMILRDNSDAIVATESLLRQLDLGIFLADIEDLRRQLQDQKRMERLRSNAWRHRESFTFDYHADRLLAFFREVIESRSG